jgi:hypothetical protein
MLPSDAMTESGTMRTCRLLFAARAYSQPAPSKILMNFWAGECMQPEEWAALIVANAPDARTVGMALAALEGFLFACVCTLTPSAGSAFFLDTPMRRTAKSGTQTMTYAWVGQIMMSQSVMNGATPVSTTSYVSHGDTPLWENGSATGLLVHAHDPLGNVSGLVGYVNQSPTIGCNRAFAYDAFGRCKASHISRLQIGARPLAHGVRKG